MTDTLAGKFDVAVIGLLTVIVYEICVGVVDTEVGPLIVVLRTGTCVADGTTGFDGADGALGPLALTACTVNVYVVPLVRPPTNAVAVLPLAGGGMLTTMPPGFEVTA